MINYNIPDVDPSNLSKRSARIEKAERLWDLLLDNLTQLFEGNVIQGEKTYTDEQGNEVVEKVYQVVSAADRAAVIRLMMQSGVSLDPNLLPKSLRDAMRRDFGDPSEGIEEDVA